MKLYTTLLLLLVAAPYIYSQPVNDECIDATIIDASANITIVGDTTDAIVTVVEGDAIQGVWYQDESSTDEEVTGIACSEDVTLLPYVLVYSGEDCESQEVLRLFTDSICVSFAFTHEANSKYRLLIVLADVNADAAAGKFNLTLSSQAVIIPSNDECLDAVEVDASSNVPVFGDTTNAVPSLVDDFFDPVIGVWYKGTTTSDEVVTATVCNEDTTLNAIVLAFRDEDCEYLSVVDYAQKEECATVSFATKANQLFRLLVTLNNNEFANTEGKFELSLSSRLRNTPPNEECISAITIDPTAGQEITGTTVDSFSGAVHYKFDVGSGNSIATTATVCSDSSFSSIVTFSSSDCEDQNFGIGNITSEGCTSISFVPSQSSTNYLEIRLGEGGGSFSLTVTSKSAFFEIIDSTTDTGITVLQNEISYEFYPIVSSQLNIRANFDSSVPVESVRLTLDNPRRSLCERVAPYALFGDVNGDYKNGTIPIGSNVVTATPYAQRACKGRPGRPLTQAFEVKGCNVNYYIYDEDGYVDGLAYDESQTYNLPPCQFNIEANLYCGFEISVVRLDLRNKATNRIIRRIRDRSRPFQLYPNTLGTLGVGSYTVEVTVDNIYHPPNVTFVVSEECNNWI